MALACIARRPLAYSPHAAAVVDIASFGISGVGPLSWHPRSDSVSEERSGVMPPSVDGMPRSALNARVWHHMGHYLSVSASASGTGPIPESVMWVYLLPVCVRVSDRGVASVIQGAGRHRLRHRMRGCRTRAHGHVMCMSLSVRHRDGSVATAAEAYRRREVIVRSGYHSWHLVRRCLVAPRSSCWRRPSGTSRPHRKLWSGRACRWPRAS